MSRACLQGLLRLLQTLSRHQEPFYLPLVLVSWYNLGKLSFEELGLVINDIYKVSNCHTVQLFVLNQIFQLDNFCIANSGPQKRLAPFVLVSAPLQALIMDQPTVNFRDSFHPKIQIIRPIISCQLCSCILGLLLPPGVTEERNTNLSLFHFQQQ